MHSTEIERAVLNIVLSYGDKSLASKDLRVGFFTDPHLSLVAKAIIEDRLYDGHLIDHKLSGQKGYLGYDEVRGLYEPCSREPYTEYVAVLRSEYIKREKLLLLNTGQQLIVNEDPDWDSKIMQIESKLSALNLYKGSDRRIYRLSEFQDEAYSRLVALGENPNAFTGVPTGIHELDQTLGGLQKQDLIILAARPSMGKSALITTVAENLQILSPESNILIFSLEMSKEQLLHRLVASIAKIPLHNLRHGILDLAAWARLIYARRVLEAANIYINDTPALTPLEIGGFIEEMILADKRPDVVFIDYLQLMRTPKHYDNRVTEVTQLSGESKALAKRYNIPVVMLSQLSRGPEGRTNKRPILSDLRESGAIEQDADVVGFLYRDHVYNPTPSNEYLAEIIISKQRNGPIGTISCAFIKPFTRFENIVT